MNFRFFPITAVIVTLLTGCVSTEKRKPEPPAAAPQPPVEDIASKFANTPGSPRIRLDIGDQRAYYTKGGTLVTSSRISTGKPGYGTPKGSFAVSQKVENYVSRTYGKIVDASGVTVNADADSRKDSVPDGGRFVGAPMPYFMRFNSGIGMHAGIVPNYPASHGCVRLPRKMARLFFENTPVGTPVIVTD
jgi:lipoprotein-anchoring transpeptidase ErfK/SrfK